jgi:hypothetical protein
VRRSEPALHRPVPSRPVGLSLFRFEGAALCGSLPVTSPSASCRARADRITSRSPSGGPRVSVSAASLSAHGGGWTAHPVRALVGRLFRLLSAMAFAVGGDGDPSSASRCTRPLRIPKRARASFVLQATKSQRWMPWRLKPKKDVGDCEKPREAVYQATIRGYPNGATQHLS